MDAGISPMGMGSQLPMGMGMQRQTRGQGKGGGKHNAFNEQLMSIPGFADSLQASQQRMAQDPNANMMRTQPALPNAMNSVAQPAQPQGPMSIDEFSRSSLMGPMTQDFRNPVEFEGGMYDPRIVSQYEQYRSGQTQQPMNQIGDMRFMQPSQASIQAQLAADAQRRANPFHQQMQMQADALQGRRQAPQMNEQIRMQQVQQMMQQQMMQQRQMPFQMQPQMNNPMFGGLGALGAPFGGGYGSYARPQFGRGFGGKGGRGFSRPQMSGSFGGAMGLGLGGLGGLLSRQFV